MEGMRNQHIFEFFKKAKSLNKLAHAYLFWGGEKEEKLELADYLKNLLDVGDLDVFRVSSEKNEISINQIRAIKKHLSLSPFSGFYKLAIIEEAEKLNSEAANALLKLLEEPHENTILILISAAPELIPKTLISRVQEIRFRSRSLNDISKSFLDEKYNAFFKMPLNKAFREMEKIVEEDTQIMPLLNSWLFYCRNKLIETKDNNKRKELAEIVKNIENTKQMISAYNINKRLALENLFLLISKN